METLNMFTKFTAVGRFILAYFGLLFCCILFVFLYPIRAIVEWWHFGPAQRILRVVRWACPTAHVFHEMREFQKMIGTRLITEWMRGQKK